MFQVLIDERIWLFVEFFIARKNANPKGNTVPWDFVKKYGMKIPNNVEISGKSKKSFKNESDVENVLGFFEKNIKNGGL